MGQGQSAPAPVSFVASPLARRHTHASLTKQTCCCFGPRNRKSQSKRLALKLANPFVAVVPIPRNLVTNALS